MKRYRRYNVIADAIITAISFLSAMYIRAYSETGLFSLPSHYYQYLWILYFLLVIWPLLLYINGLYPTNRLRTVSRAAQIIVKSCLQGLFIILSVFFIFKLHIISRLIIAYFCVIVSASLIVKEAAVIYILRVARTRGLNLRNAAIVGSKEKIREVVSGIEENSYLGLKTVGVLLPLNETREREVWGQKVLGSLGDIDRVLRENPIDLVIITVDRKDYSEVEDIIFHCEEQGVEIWLTASLFNIKTGTLDVDNLFGTPVFVFHMGPKFSWQLLAKDIIDKVGSFILGIFGIPFVLVAAIAIKMTSEGPVFFRQIRCGLQGRQFTLYKLRTMYIGAEKMQKDLEAKNIMKGPVFKVEDDPRVTKVGRFLRKISLDEVPQFWNVLKGDMSLVGPRPPIPEEVKQYKGWQRRRLSMKPGITGLWQISGRSTITDFDKLANYDLEYIDRWSLWLDLRILIKTIFVVLSTKGSK